MPVSLQNNFTAGHFSSRLRGRSDISKYKNAASEVLNMSVMQHGGIIRRSGTKFVNPIQDQTAKAKLIPFRFSLAQTYQLEFGNLTLRFFTNRGQVRESVALSTPFASWSSSVATLTVASHNAVVGDNIVASVTGASSYDGTYTVTAITATTISYALTSDPGGTPSAGTVQVPYQIVSPYTTAQLTNLEYNQSADILYLTHPDVRPKELVRSGATNWAFGNFDFKDGPYLKTNTTATEMTPVAITGSGIEIAASAASFVSTDVGRLIRLRDTGGTAWGWAEIVTFTDTTHVDVDIKDDFVNTTATTAWRLGAWTDTPIVSGSTAKSWPWISVFGQERLWFCAINDQPNHYWSSNTADFNLMTPDSLSDSAVIDTHGIDREISDDQVNAIYWMSSGPRGMLIGTNNAEYLLQNRAEFDPLTPENVAVSVQTSKGSKRNVRRQLAGSGILIYCQKVGRKLNEIAFATASEKFDSNDISVLAEDITIGGIEELAYQQEPFSTIWSMKADGTFLGTTYERSQDVVGWSKNFIGGTFAEDLVSPFASWLGGVATLTVASHNISRGDSITVSVTGATSYNGTYTVLSTTATTIKYAITSDPGGTPSAGTVSTPRAVVESISSVSDDSGSRIVDQVWFIVKRTINGTTKRYVEYMEDFFDVGDRQNDAYFVDGGITTTGSAFTTVSKLDHLEGQIVSVLADGATHPDKTVSGGSITLERSADKAHVGLPYNTRLVPMPIVFDGFLPGSRFKLRRAYKAHIEFHQTLGAKVGQSLSNLVTVNFRTGSDALSSPVPLFTGIKEELVSFKHENEQQVFIVQDQPLPMTILSYAVESVLDNED